MRESRVCERVKFAIYNIAIVFNFRQHSARDFRLDIKKSPKSTCWNYEELRLARGEIVVLLGRIETFRFKDENDYEYEIWLKLFSRILKI